MTRRPGAGQAAGSAQRAGVGVLHLAALVCDPFHSRSDLIALGRIVREA